MAGRSVSADARTVGWQEELTWEVAQAFPVDPTGLAADRWLEMLTQYRFVSMSGTDVEFRVPDTARVCLIRHRGVHLLVVEPMHAGGWAFGAGGWLAPHG